MLINVPNVLVMIIEHLILLKNVVSAHQDTLKLACKFVQNATSVVKLAQMDSILVV